MPFTYNIDRETRWIEIRITGTISIDEVSQAMRGMLADAEYSDDFSGIIDVRQMTNVLNVSELRGLADVQLARPGPAQRSRRAVIVASPAHYSTARVFMIFAEAGPVQYEVFYTLESAMAWLQE